MTQHEFLGEIAARVKMPDDFPFEIVTHPGGSIYIGAGMSTIRLSNHPPRSDSDCDEDFRVRLLGASALKRVIPAVRRAVKRWKATPDVL